MRLRHSQPAAPAGRPFTLIELLTVMLIAGIMLAITVPVVVKITSGSSVEAASRMIGAQLRLARQEAIVRRRAIAVVFPTSDLSPTERTGYAGFRSCTLQPGTNVFDSWIPNTTWSYVPTGSAIAEVDSDGGPNAVSAPDLQDDTVVTVTGVPDIGAVRAVIFLPSGRLKTTQRVVTVVEGVATGNTWARKSDGNWIEVALNQYTGRVSFVRPEDIL